MRLENISSEKLTVVLLTYNRLLFLKKAIESCLKQTNHGFNLLIVDNASNDGTTEYLSNLSIATAINFKLISNPQNIGPKGSFLRALSEIQESNWLTILCDDDLLDENFVQRFYELRKIYPKSSCITMSVAEIDVFDKVFSYCINPTNYFDPLSAFKSICKGTIRPAGVSGFAFPANLKRVSDYLIQTDTPNGYLDDTMMFIIASIERGLVSDSNVGYFRRNWPEQTSSFSNERTLHYFLALLIFDRYLRKTLSNKNYSYIKKHHKVMGLYQFFRIVQFPIIVNGSLSFNDCIEYLSSTLKHNHRYIPHALSMFLLLPVVLKFSLPTRMKLNALRKKIFNN